MAHMAETANGIIRRYLEDTIAAEKSAETRLQGFASDGDDEEVKATFRDHAVTTRHQYERLSARLEELGGSPSTGKTILAQVLGYVPKIGELSHTEDEKTTQNLISAYAQEHSERAMYEALATLARAVGDTVTESLAREIQAEEEETADRVKAFLPSRAKIAFNMLTVGEVDPSVETKAL